MIGSDVHLLGRDDQLGAVAPYVIVGTYREQVTRVATWSVADAITELDADQAVSDLNGQLVENGPIVSATRSDGRVSI